MTEDQIEQLTKLWAEGLSASQIGDQIGVTKNAVIGKAHRLGLASRKQGAQETTGPHYLREHVRKAKRTMRIPRSPMEPYEPAYQHPTGQPVSLFDAGPHHCRWPITEVSPIEKFLFCGKMKTEETSYCPFHARISRGNL